MRALILVALMACSCGAGAATKAKQIAPPKPTPVPQVGDFHEINPRDFQLMLQMKLNAQVWTTALEGSVNSYAADRGCKGQWEVDWNKGRLIYRGPENVSGTAR